MPSACRVGKSHALEAIKDDGRGASGRNSPIPLLPVPKLIFHFPRFLRRRLELDIQPARSESRYSFEPSSPPVKSPCTLPRSSPALAIRYKRSTVATAAIARAEIRRRLRVSSFDLSSTSIPDPWLGNPSRTGPGYQETSATRLLPSCRGKLSILKDSTAGQVSRRLQVHGWNHSYGKSTSAAVPAWRIAFPSCSPRRSSSDEWAHPNASAP